MTARRALVTGGTGFIGANLVAALNERGITARVLHRVSSSTKALEGLVYETALGDVLDEPSALAEAMAGCDWVFHAAAVSDYWRQDGERLYEVNIEGTRRVLAAAVLAGVSRFIFTSSMASLGWPDEGEVITEDSTFNLAPDRWPYAHSKHLAEAEVLKAAAEGLEAIIVHPTVVLGPRDVNVGSGLFIVEAAKGTMWFYPPGGTNYVFVGDVVEGHLRAAEMGEPGQRYILAGPNLTHKEAFEIICEEIGRPKPWLPLPQVLMPVIAAGVSIGRRIVGQRILIDADQVRIASLDLYVDGSKAANAFGLRATPFRETVRQAYTWYRQHGYIP